MKNVIISHHDLKLLCSGTLTWHWTCFSWEWKTVNFKGQIIGTNFAFIIKYLNILKIQQSTIVWWSMSLTSSGTKVWVWAFHLKKKRHFQIYQTEPYLKNIRVNTPFYRYILAIIQVALQLAKASNFFPDFSHLLEPKENQSCTSAWKNFFHTFRALTDVFSQLIIEYKRQKCFSTYLSHQAVNP